MKAFFFKHMWTNAENANEEKKHTDPFHVISHWAVGKVWHRSGESVCVCVYWGTESFARGRESV